jgi:hypothetical protein
MPGARVAAGGFVLILNFSDRRWGSGWLWWLGRKGSRIQGAKGSSDMLKNYKELKVWQPILSALYGNLQSHRKISK